MAALYPGQVDVAAIGRYFVKQYYQVIQQTPQVGFQFYTDASMMVRVDGETETTATSTMNIHTVLSELNFTSIEVKTVKSLCGWAESVLVMVSGLVQMQEYSGRRQFVQTFLLAPQEKGYFVLNDIFHLLDEETTLQSSAAVLGHDSYDDSSNLANHHMQDPHHIQDPVMGYTSGEEIQTRDYVSPVNALEEELHAREYVASLHAEEINPVDDHIILEPQQAAEADEKLDEVPIEEPVVPSPGAAPTMNEPPVLSAGEPLGERPKQTYASILRFAKGQPSNTVPRAAPVAKTAAVVSDAQVATQQSYPTTSVQPENFSPEPVEDVTTPEDDGEFKSVYVGNLSSSVSASDLEHEFKNFGKILPNGVTVRSRKDSGGFYAFVEFEDAASVQNALQASPLYVNGQKIYVEGRRPNSGIARMGGGRRGRGRGGYQSDRGRFGGRGFGRGGGYDNNDRDYNSSRPRGNGVLQRVPRQERGILGNHAARNGQNPSEAAY